MTTLIRCRTNSAASDLGFLYLSVPKVPNLNANIGDPDQTRRFDMSLHVCKCPQNAFGQNYFKFRGVSFILFDVSLKNKILHCK